MVKLVGMKYFLQPKRMLKHFMHASFQRFPLVRVSEKQARSKRAIMVGPLSAALAYKETKKEEKKTCKTQTPITHCNVNNFCTHTYSVRVSVFCRHHDGGQPTDTENLYTQVTQSIAEPYGKTYTWEIKQTIMGLQRDEAAEAIVAALELPLTPAEYVEISTERINRVMEQCQLMPGNVRVPKGWS